MTRLDVVTCMMYVAQCYVLMMRVRLMAPNGRTRERPRIECVSYAG